MKDVAHRMRVLHVIDSFERRGAERFASGLIRFLNDQGVEQRAVVLTGSPDDGLKYETLSTVPDPVYRIPGLKIDIGTLAALRHEVAISQPHIIQAHGGDALKYAALASSKRANKLVARMIGMPGRRVQRGPRRAVYSRLIRRAACVVAVAHAVRREVIEVFHVAPSRVVTIPTARDSEAIRSPSDRTVTRRALGIPSRAPVLVSLGALTWEKDPLAYLHVVERVAAAHPDVMHLMIGDGPLRDAVHAEVIRRSLNGRVHILGSRDDVGDLLAASDLMLFLSRKEGMEGMPGALIEAGFTGIPTVGYDVAGAAEVVIDGATGILVRPGAIAEVTDAVIRLIGDPRTRKSMGQRARVHCLPRFDIRVVAPRYLDLYREVSSAARTSRRRALPRDEVSADSGEGSGAVSVYLETPHHERVSPWGKG